LNAPLTGLPPYKTVAAALRKTTEVLAREVVRPSESVPDWNETEWAIARSVAAMQGITVLLANRLRWRGPPLWRSFLAQQSAQSLLRDERIGELLGRIDSAARGAGLACVALKGSALRALGLYAQGERPMADVDLLVREADGAAAANVMRRVDYEQTLVVTRHAIYKPRGRSKPVELGEHVDSPVTVEVHTAVTERLPAREADITARLQSPQQQPGVNAYPTLAALLLHLLLHAAGSIKSHSLRQIQLHDIALVADRLADDDWRSLNEIAKVDEGLWWAYPPLALALRYYDCAAAGELTRAARASCPRILRRLGDRKTLTDVSRSNPWFTALPGIAWSRTPADALRYARSRALPDRATRVSIGGVLDGQPHLHRLPWYQLTQSGRVLRWLLSRPTRPPTITTVAAALRYPEP
jgi:hypothetical protein